MLSLSIVHEGIGQRPQAFYCFWHLEVSSIHPTSACLRSMPSLGKPQNELGAQEHLLQQWISKPSSSTKASDGRFQVRFNLETM